MSNEFETISKFFKPIEKYGDQKQFIVGQGDDCAVIRPSTYPLAISIDTQVESIHFFSDMEPGAIAHRGLCSALSDLAAMGAEPAFFTLALSIPKHINDTWLAAYSRQLANLANQYGISLIGGDTTSSPTLVQTFQVHGYLYQKPLTRSEAKPGDLIVVTGTLGDAALAVKKISEQQEVHPDLLSAYNAPLPRFDISRIIANKASACIDISDGLIADLGHICEQSQCGANLYLDQLPLSAAFKNEKMTSNLSYQFSAAGGDDYQLCFTIAEAEWETLPKQAIPLTVVGQITSDTQVNCYDKYGNPIQLQQTGFQHR